MKTVLLTLAIALSVSTAFASGTKGGGDSYAVDMKTRGRDIFQTLLRNRIETVHGYNISALLQKLEAAKIHTTEEVLYIEENGRKRRVSYINDTATETITVNINDYRASGDGVKDQMVVHEVLGLFGEREPDMKISYEILSLANSESTATERSEDPFLKDFIPKIEKILRDYSLSRTQVITGASGLSDSLSLSCNWLLKKQQAVNTHGKCLDTEQGRDLVQRIAANYRVTVENFIIIDFNIRTSVNEALANDANSAYRVPLERADIAAKIMHEKVAAVANEIDPNLERIKLFLEINGAIDPSVVQPVIDKIRASDAAFDAIDSAIRDLKRALGEYLSQNFKGRENFRSIDSAELAEKIKTPNRTSYVYFGSREDVGFALGNSATKMLVAVNLYLVSNMRAAKAIAATVCDETNVRAIAYGWSGEGSAICLNDKEANDFLTVVSAIADSGSNDPQFMKKRRNRN